MSMKRTRKPQGRSTAFLLMESDKFYRKPRTHVRRALLRSQIVRNVTDRLPGINWRMI